MLGHPTHRNCSWHLSATPSELIFVHRVINITTSVISHPSLTLELGSLHNSGLKWKPETCRRQNMLNYNYVRQSLRTKRVQFDINSIHCSNMFEANHTYSICKSVAWYMFGQSVMHFSCMEDKLTTNTFSIHKGTFIQTFKLNNTYVLSKVFFLPTCWSQCSAIVSLLHRLTVYGCAFLAHSACAIQSRGVKTQKKNNKSAYLKT